ncbi:hypothetical protein A3A03_02910 [Candidatus Nomurabacteria bacterium RIFCSPLOWO2_01_FULL_40_18]|uniref:Polysaccharide pyruvyl transferase domain-containing protein n=1 Tax=Candidatus Nomurabacteria bacterium RIFCSPLOWO2_01_FULL_40_18 TaxID=1801773 RepID=A0A1F6XKA8_9BACT|nr:MAG: hypothetical protein A3A03_02910 [Candidatus Nomurabacteria bacterium RIFCSPLOWO2_01_FULL_40_18]
MKDKKYGLLSYTTGNLGDEIQSLAARYFLPRVDIYLDRDNDLKKVKSNKKIKLILNGWFSHKPQNWPPSENIDPLFISFHIAKSAVKEFTSPSSIAYFKKHEPIGCRDAFTQNLLESSGVRAYFSGCLTLTLQRPSVKRTSQITIADIDEDIKNLLPEELKTKAIYTTHWSRSPSAKKLARVIPIKLKSFFRILKINTLVWSLFSKTKEEKFASAKRMLEQYAKSKLVVTSRLHCALPCLAFGTPVLFIHKNLNDQRFGGLLKYLHAYSLKELRDNPTQLEWKNPLPNPRDIEPLRQELQRKCKEFIDLP